MESAKRKKAPDLNAGLFFLLERLSLRTASISKDLHQPVILY
jgi:hypothetical protein